MKSGRKSKETERTRSTSSSDSKEKRSESEEKRRSTRNQENKKEEEKDDGKMEFGRRMFDDDMNTFFERIQEIAGQDKAFEGLCPIQLFSVNELIDGGGPWWKCGCCFRMKDETRMGTPFFPGKKKSCQVLLDKRREHFVLISYDPTNKWVDLYDSLYKDGNRTRKHFPRTICYQICSVYGHLAERGRLKVRLHTDFETQEDDWSCGYRCIGAVLQMYKKQNPADMLYDLEKIYDFYQKVITKDKNGNYPKIDWEEIKNIKVGSDRELLEFYCEEQVLKVDERDYGLGKSTKDDEDDRDEAETEQPTEVKSATSVSNSRSETSTEKRRMKSGKEIEEKKESVAESMTAYPIRLFTKLSNFIFKNK